MKKLLLPLLMVIGLCVGAAACDDAKITPAESTAIGCKTFGNVIEDLTPLVKDGTLNDSTVTIVDTTKHGVDEVCLGRSPNVDATTKDIIVQNGLGVVQAIAAQFLSK